MLARLPDARVPLRRYLFEESKAIASETLAATKRELNAQISKLQDKVVKLEADVEKAASARSGAEEAAEKLQHELNTTKREADLVRSELATSSGEFSGKLTVRQNVTKGEICKLSAEVFTLQQHLMEQAQKSAEAEKKSAEAYQQDLVSLNSLLERSREMRERDRASFGSALDVAHSDLRSKENVIKEAQDRLQDVLNQLSSSRELCAELSHDAENVRRVISSNEQTAAERIVRAVRTSANSSLVRSITHRWRRAAQPYYDISAAMIVLHAKRLHARSFQHWRWRFVTRIRNDQRINVLWQRWKLGRVMVKFNRWRNTTGTKRHFLLSSRRIVFRLTKIRCSSAFCTWHLQSFSSKVLKRQQMRATVHWDRTCMGRWLRALRSLSASRKRRLVQGQRLWSQICRRHMSSSMDAWTCQIRDLRNSVAAYYAHQESVRSRRALSRSFDVWCLAFAPESVGDSPPCRLAKIFQQRRCIRHFCRAWESYTKIRSHLRSENIRASHHIARVRQERAVRRLRAYAGLGKGLALRHRRLVARSSRTLMVYAMRLWCDVWKDRKTTLVRNDRYAVRFRRVYLAQVIQKWKRGVNEICLKTSSKRKAEVKYSFKILARAFMFFSDHRLDDRTLQKKTHSIAQKRLSRLYAWNFRVWLQFASANRCCARRGAAVNLRRTMLDRGLLRKCLTWWLQYVCRKAMLVLIGNTASSKIKRSQKVAAFLAWHSVLRRFLSMRRAKSKKCWGIIAMSFDAWSYRTSASRVEITNQRESDRLHLELEVVKNELELVMRRETDSREQLDQLHDVRIPALESENRKMSETLELVQMELEAKKAEAVSTKTQVSMLQDTIAEMRGFLNDPGLQLQCNADLSDGVKAAAVCKELEAERRNTGRLQSEIMHKESEISQLTSQVSAMEQKVTRAQKLIESLEAQTSTDIQVVVCLMLKVIGPAVIRSLRICCWRRLTYFPGYLNVRMLSLLSVRSA